MLVKRQVKLEDLAPQQLADFLSVELLAQESDSHSAGSAWIFHPPKKHGSGWWFGCHQFYFPIYWVAVIIPIDEVIFFRGVAQPPKNRVDQCIIVVYE